VCVCVCASVRVCESDWETERGGERDINY